ncbi:immunity 53 family protein [Kineococcus sp. R86509]|uniref:immunity 53 family protein n=1 Tax=Kineococcus sp. R86509 TaxID=3093851 RepID=UPI0036D35F36
MIFSRRKDADPDPGPDPGPGPGPGPDPDRESPPGALEWLQAWFTSNCDDEWEHGEGIRIETLDNPGWHIKIDLADTAAAGQKLHPLKLERSEHDWYVIRREEDTFVAACGPLNLGEVLYLFRRWVQGDQDHDATETASL